jgi:hypothetical protein
MAIEVFERLARAPVAEVPAEKLLQLDDILLEEREQSGSLIRRHELSLQVGVLGPAK